MENVDRLSALKAFCLLRKNNVTVLQKVNITEVDWLFWFFCSHYQPEAISVLQMKIAFGKVLTKNK